MSFEKHKKHAFSLVELAAVLIVIAIITVGVMKGSKMIRDSRIASARSLTSSAKISQIDGLLAWYETSMKESIEREETIDNSQLSIWHDISSQRPKDSSNNSLTKTPDSNVIYRENGINSLPSIQFAASGRFSLSEFYQGHFSRNAVFAVLSPTLDPSGIYMEFIDSYLSGNSNAIGISSSDIRVVSGSTGKFTASFGQSQEYVIGIYLNNGVSTAFVNDIDAADSISSMNINGFEGLTVGADKNGGDNFTGLISEIIVFNRILSEKERIIVMSYLAKKYGIRVAGAY